MIIEKIGLKDNHGKNKLELILPEWIEGIGEVLTYGANKYKPNSWQNVENGIDVHYGAAMRHIVAYRKGEYLDKETNLPHLYHAVSNLLFIINHEENKENKTYEDGFNKGLYIPTPQE